MYFSYFNRQDICPAFLSYYSIVILPLQSITYFFLFLINYHSISHNGIGTDRIASFLYRIPGVSFYGIDSCSVTAFHDSYMVARSIMLPVKKDDHTGTWHTPSPLPFPLILKPVLTIRTKGKLGNRTTLNQTCLIRTPADKAGTPFLPAGKSIPRPKLLSAFISKLTFCNIDKLSISKKSGKPTATGIIPHHMRHILRIAITRPAMGCCLLLGKL